MSSLRLILWDQLSEDISSLGDYSPDTDIIVMCEVWEEIAYVQHHKKKIAFLLSAMRHFAASIREKGYRVEYVKLDDPENTGSLKKEVIRLLKTSPFTRVVVTTPSEYHILEDIRTWEDEMNVTVDIRADNRFLCSVDTFFSWARGRKNLRMEYFYREMRKQHNVLMENDHPVGGKWNYDVENRNPPKLSLDIPKPYMVQVDDITQEVLGLVSAKFKDHFGDLYPFYFAVTRQEALHVLNQFIGQRLSYFGDYQDAMIQGEPWMYHAHISFYLNCGLLLPIECIQAAETAYFVGKAPLNAVEGFIRQIMGWREYIRGIYWLKMPVYAELNFLNADRTLPNFYWTGDTTMNCLRQCVLETKQNAYAHHIQRLMVLGNFALLAGIHPKYVNEWFWIVYADAYEWVELPNVTGMILFADGGYLASKPYAAGGSYINKMSNYCKNCSYSVRTHNGSNACPFNYLYWNFLAKNRQKLAKNNRLSMMYKLYDRMSLDRKAAIESDSIKFLNALTYVD